MMNEKKTLFMEEKGKITEALAKIRKDKEAGQGIYFDRLELKVGLLIEQQKDVSNTLKSILLYLEAIEADQSIFSEEPRIEEYEGQEIIWPTTLCLWQQDMEEIIEQAKLSQI